MAKIIDEAAVSLLVNKRVALVIGGYINALGIIRSLGEDRSVTIVNISGAGSTASKSRYCDYQVAVNSRSQIEGWVERLLDVCEKVVIFPASDRDFLLINQLSAKNSESTFPTMDERFLDKAEQISIADSIGIHYPKSLSLSEVPQDKEQVNIPFPWIIKPSESISEGLFKAEITSDIEVLKRLVKKCADVRTSAIVAQYIDGNDADLYTLGGYSINGNLEEPFVGRKLAQRPHLRGLASIAEPKECEEVVAQGRKFLREINYTGEFQIEFKRSEKDGNYYFIEFNPRNWFWSRVAVIGGNNFHLRKYQYEMDGDYFKGDAGNVSNAVFFSGEHVLYNIVKERRSKPLITLIKAVFSRRQLSPSILSLNDPKPFFVSLRWIFQWLITGKSTVR